MFSIASRKQVVFSFPLRQKGGVSLHKLGPHGSFQKSNPRQVVSALDVNPALPKRPSFPQITTFLSRSIPITFAYNTGTFGLKPTSELSMEAL